MNGIGIAIAIFGLGILIAVHEFGHFITGKMLRLKVLEFVIGLPLGPKLFSFRRGETTYGVSAALFGGYVKFAELLSIMKLKVEGVAKGSPAEVAGFKPGDLITRVNGEPVQEWIEVYDKIYGSAKRSETAVAVYRNGVEEFMTIDPIGFSGIAISRDKKVFIEDIPRSFEAQKAWKRGLIVFSGPAMNLITAVVIIFIIGLIGFPRTTTTLEGVVPGSPAEVVGIKAGDKIVEIDRIKVESWDDVTGQIQKKAGKKIDVEVERSGKKLNFSAKLKKKSTKGLLGIITKLERKPETVAGAAKESFVFIWQTTSLLGGFFKQLVTEPGKVLPFVRSPIGIVRETAPIAQRDILDFFTTLAGISVAISIFNLLPLPPLDGGRLFISAIEGIIRRPISREAMLVSNAVGISLLLLLMTYAVIGDIFRQAVPGG